MKTTSSIEALEPRIAPATLVNPTTVTYSDVDGDDIKIKLSKPIFDIANIATVLTFTNGVARPDGSIPQYLSVFSVGAFDAGEANKLNITITAKRSVTHGGDGLANIGRINATTGNATDLGAVKVQGDVIAINAGDADLATRALKSLDVLSFSQQDTGETSNLAGPVGKITIRGNMVGEILQTGVGAGIGSLFIGGTLGNGGNTAKAGHIVTQGTIASLRIMRDAIGGFADSANVTGKIGKLFIGGSLIGGTEANSGSFHDIEIGSVTIKGDIVGGTTSVTGNFLFSGGTTTRIVIGGSILGSAFSNTGIISGGTASIGLIAIGGSLVGGESTLTGNVSGSLDKVIIGGDLVGKAFPDTGAIISADSLTSVVVKGSVLGRNGGIRSGSIHATAGSIGSVFIGGDLARADIIAGILPGADNQYGIGVGANADTDAEPGVVNRIGSIVIKGVVIRTTGNFAFEANEIGKVKVGTVNYRHNDPTISYSTGFTVDNDRKIIVREI